jgi:hypothetical protein
VEVLLAPEEQPAIAARTAGVLVRLRTVVGGALSLFSLFLRAEASL